MCPFISDYNQEPVRISSPSPIGYIYLGTLINLLIDETDIFFA